MTWLGDIRALGVPEVARRLGVRVVDRQHLSPCPACQATTRSRSDTRVGALFLSSGGRGWTCGHCGEHGGSVELASWVLLGKRVGGGSTRWGELREKAAGVLCGEGSPPPPEQPPPPRSRVPPAEVAELWERCGPVDRDDEVASWLERRVLPVDEVAARDLCRALPRGDLPVWARMRGAPWSSGWRAVFRAWDDRGRLASLRARWVHPGPPPEGAAKAGAAAGGPGSATGLVLADDEGRRVLTGEARGEQRLAVVEGEPDWLSGCLRHRCVVGVWSGAWCPEIGRRVPEGSVVSILTHGDDAGDRYAKAIARTLQFQRVIRQTREGR